MTEIKVGLRTAGIVYNPQIAAAEGRARELASVVGRLGAEVRVCSSLSTEEMASTLRGADLAVTVGGDGTVLRAAHAAAPLGIPILAVNLGRVGFLSEVTAEEAGPTLERVAAGEGWVERRIMLRVEHPLDGRVWRALNDVVMSRGFKARVIGVRLFIDEVFVDEVLADGVVVASPTGSTAYNLALGGPVLDPEADCLLITGIATYPRPAPTLVVPAEQAVRLQILSDHGGGLTVDGQDAHELDDGDQVTVRRSQHTALFWRLRPRRYFYRHVLERLK